MHQTEELTTVLKRLRLSGLLHSMDLRVRQAADDNLDVTEFLYRLLCDEVERRDAHQADLRFRRANFDAQNPTMSDL